MESPDSSNRGGIHIFAKNRTQAEWPGIGPLRPAGHAGKGLDLSLDRDYELVRLAGVIPWDRLAEAFGPLYCADNDRPGVPIRLMAGLHYLKHLKGISDEQTVRDRVENPYWPFFCGEEFFQHALPIDSSQMTRWRQRIGEAGPAS